CSPGTREKILLDIVKWATSTKPDTLGYWMSGMAGTGKSTIAMSICMKLRDEGLLAGSFFCSCQIPECRDYRLIIPTLAYQLEKYSGRFAASLIEALHKDPDLPRRKPEQQVKTLLIEPWQTVIKDQKMLHQALLILDALDECDKA
ncbi:hypothetical protein BT96DRAFT_750586, partial [Gymnopus androsaceus JB14]